MRRVRESAVGSATVGAALVRGASSPTSWGAGWSTPLSFAAREVVAAAGEVTVEVFAELSPECETAYAALASTGTDQAARATWLAYWTGG